MKWFRSNIRHGARLALFAMLVQFALTFGHSHWFAQAATLAQSSLQQAAKTDSVASVDGAVFEKQSPAGQDGDSADDNCAVCAVVAMADTIVSSTPPLLLLPQAIRLLHRAADAEFVRLQSARTAFQPRAPPIS